MRTWSEPGLEKSCPGLTWSVCITGTALRLLWQIPRFKSNIIPTPISEHIMAHHQQTSGTFVEELSALLSNTFISSDTNYQSGDGADQHVLGELEALCMQSKENPVSMKNTLEEWLTIEDDELVKQDEVGTTSLGPCWKSSCPQLRDSASYPQMVMFCDIFSL